MDLKIKNVFVTVGTTEFNQLIAALSTERLLKCLYSLGCEKLVIQVGAGSIPSDLERNIKNFNEMIDITFYRYKNTLQNDIEEADLIISHCGSGTIFECLKMKKKIVAVVNETLMDNHQTQLADVMNKERHLVKTKPSDLIKILEGDEFLERLSSLKEIGDAKTNLFAEVVYEEVGIIPEDED